MCKSADLVPTPELLRRSIPFSEAALQQTPLKLDTCAFVKIEGELYELVCSYVTKYADPRSHRLRVQHANDSDGSTGAQRSVVASLGLGVFGVTWNGHDLWVLHEELGEPVGTQCGATFFRHMYLLVQSSAQLPVVHAFCNQLLAEADITQPREFTIYRWNTSNHYWHLEDKVPARAIESVVLPETTKKKLVDDLDAFLSKGTANWYRHHGIPYKRSYLFYGVPGAGKTSLLQAIAGKYGRNLCYLSPTHPSMTDDGLKNAVNRVPGNSLIVLEDIDALFGPDRSKKVEGSPLTFSGLLNALDGVGRGGGQLFVLTSNHRERLDPALIRAGRVDLHVRFDWASKEQMERLFGQFYPDADSALSASFAQKLVDALGPRHVSMAGLQHYFVDQRTSTAEVAATEVDKIVSELDEREFEQKDADGTGS